MKVSLTAYQFAKKMVALYGFDFCLGDPDAVVVSAKTRLESDMECDQLAISYDRVADSINFVFSWDEIPPQRVLDKIKGAFPNCLPA